MTTILDEKLIEDVKSIIKEENRRTLMQLTNDMRPADLADLIEHLNPDERLYIIETGMVKTV